MSALARVEEWLRAGAGNAAPNHARDCTLEPAHTITQIAAGTDGRVVIWYVTPTTPKRNFREPHSVSGATLLEALAALSEQEALSWLSRKSA